MRNTRDQIHTTRRGVALPFIALLLVVFLGMAALAVDVGILLGARTEAQRTADAAALAGATILLADGQNESLARSTAIDWAARNLIRNESVVVEPGDVDVELQNGLVRVRIYRTAARNSAVPNIFARAIGFPTADVATWAAAIAGAGNAIRCPLPFALVDRFWDTSAGQLSGWTDAIDRNNDIYNPGAREVDPASPTLPTGWSNLDIGQVWRIYPGSNQQTPTPGWYFPLSLDGGGANPNTGYGAWIRGCPRPDLRFTIGADIDIEPGAMTGPTNQGFAAVLDGDNTEWSFALNCPVQPGATRCTTPEETDRIRPILVISPLENALTQSGRQTVQIQNLAGLFIICNGTLNPGVTPQNLVRKTQCQASQGGGQGQQQPNESGVWVRFMGLQGEIGPGSTPDSNSLIRVLRLVE